MDKNHLSKTLIGDLWFVSNNFTDAFTNVQSVQKKKVYLLHFIGTSIVEYNISPIEKPYVIPFVIFFQLLVCLSVNLTCNHQTNHMHVTIKQTICYYVGE
jgi:hypothetical protein